jgi:hypothetical protein
MAEKQNSYSWWQGIAVGYLIGFAGCLAFWAYHDFQPDPKPEWISCTIGEGPNAGQDCPPLKLGADGIWHDVGLEFVAPPKTPAR